MKKPQLFICIYLYFLLTVPLVAAQSGSIPATGEKTRPDIDDLLRWHEVLTYEIQYSFFTLGKVRVEISDTLHEGQQAWLLHAVITSLRGVPFVGTEENHYSSIFLVQEGRAREQVYWKDDVDDNHYNEERYIFDYDLRKVFAFEKGELTDTLDLELPATSGPLIFLFSRTMAGEEKKSRVFIYLDQEKGSIDMNYTGKREERSYEAFDKPVNTFYADGVANINGPFGFRGNFKTWFADGPLRIPLESHLKVWLGNVKIRLINYKKELRNEEGSF